MAKGSSFLKTVAGAIDPTLDALFSSSVGPAKPKKARIVARRQADAEESSPESSPSRDEEEDEDDAESGSDNGEPGEDNDDEVMEDAAPVVPTQAIAAAEKLAVKDTEKSTSRSERKRKRKDVVEDIEGKHLRKLAEEDGDDGPSKKKQKAAKAAPRGDAADASDDDGDGGEKLVHESLVQDPKPEDIEKSNRTVFLANVSTEALTSKEAEKKLREHLSSVLDKSVKPAEKIESIRFRSLAFSSLSLPKRAAYITKSLMDETTKSCNAYVVFSTQAAARKVVTKLNATEILGRHLRVDSVAHPSPVDHKRCVFVGNLGFVDDETVINTDADGNNKSKKRYKVPSDVEEGLWRVFGEKAGKVENVRVVRDPKTRVGKGFAYVQFYDANYVEAALLLNGKKFPPMLPRPMRVTRAKNPQKTVQAIKKRGILSSSTPAAPGSAKHKPKITPDQQSMAGRASRLLGVAGAARQVRGKHGARAPRSGLSGDIKTPEQIVFEGKRASAADNMNLGKKQKGRKGGAGKKPTGKRAKRASDWKKALKKSD